MSSDFDGDEALINAFMRLAQGDFDVRMERPSERGDAPVGSKPDVLAYLFNNMAEEVSSAFTKLHLLNEELELKVEARTAALAKSLAELRATVNNLGDGLIAVDLKGQIQSANPAAIELLHLPPNVLGMDAEEALNPKLADLVKSASTDQIELQLSRGRVGAAVLSPIVEEGEPAGTVVIVRDVTVEREVDRMKSEFTSTVSHELRTPLTSVLGFAKVTRNLLERRVFVHVPSDDTRALDAVERARSNLDIIVLEGQRLTALINDVLDLSKMESGRMEWHMETVMPLDLLSRAESATASLVHDKPIAFRVEVEGYLPPIVGDFNRILQVLINLISNAVKFTAQGMVTLRARSEDATLLLSVEDTGEGIAPEQHKTVFERFRQVGDIHIDKPKGTGLGLAICTKIMEAHKGEIRLESSLGVGSTFTVVFPIDS